MQYLISTAANTDLQEILDYFFEQSIDAGDRFTTAFERKCQNIVRFPNIGKPYPHLVEGLRGINCEGYIIFYQIFDDRIVIVHVVSGYRDLQAVFANFLRE
jgi:toxin ParE1/3/4